MKKIVFVFFSFLTILSSCNVKYYDMNGIELKPKEIQWIIAANSTIVNDIDTIRNFGQIVSPYFIQSLVKVPYYDHMYFKRYETRVTFPKSKGTVNFYVDTIDHKWYLIDKNHTIYPANLSEIFKD